MENIENRIDDDKTFDLLLNLVVLKKLIKDKEVNLVHEYKKYIIRNYAKEYSNFLSQEDNSSDYYEIISSIEIEKDENLYIYLKEAIEKMCTGMKIDLSRLS